MAFRLSPFILQGFQCDAASKLMPGQLSSSVQEVRRQKANLSEEQVRRSLGPGSDQTQVQGRKRVGAAYGRAEAKSLSLACQRQEKGEGSGPVPAQTG